MPQGVYKFGPFELNIYERMLMRDGCYVPLTPKAFGTLAVLVERCGHIVEKEELISQVWPDTFVEDVSLAKNVSTLRKTLGESGEQRYIETVPKRGYRFVANVSIVEQHLDRVTVQASDAPYPSIPASGTPSPVPNPLPAKVGFWTGPRQWLIGVCLLAALAMVLWKLSDVNRPFAAPAVPLRDVPLTSFQGRQSQPVFSPDSNQIAFVSASPELDEQHLYTKLIGTEALLQLTHGPGIDSKPAWSPDGRYISFLRSSPDSRAWYLIPAIGGAERRLTDVFPYFDLGSGNSSYYSPDGKFWPLSTRYRRPLRPASSCFTWGI